MAITRTSDLDINNQSAIADSELGRLLGTIFSTTSSSAMNTMTNNIMKGQALTQGLGQNVGTSLAGAGVGIASNYIGLGITSALGNNYTGRALGAGVSTGLGTVGGKVAGNLITSGKIGNLFSGAGSINPYGLAATVVGSALSAGNGPSKEYAGRYGSTTRTMDTVYDGLTLAVNAIPGWGQLASGLMTLNKGLSNVFGSTDGMCVCAGTKVYTAKGKLINIEDLKLEDGIIGWNEITHEIRPNTIRGIIEPRLKECLRIILDNGIKLDCSIDHPILSNINNKAETHRINGKRIAYRDWSFRRADELKIGNWVGLANNIDYWGDKEMPNAYLVGMLIGDGTYTYESSCKLWTADPSTWEYLEENNLAVLIKLYTPENSNGKYLIENRDYRIINGMLLVKDLGIAYLSGNNKTLPKNILDYNRDSICKLIAGLFDTDGSISVNKEKGTYSITLYQSNLKLLQKVRILLYKLGIYSIINKREASVNKMKNGRTINSNESYRLELTDRKSILNFNKFIPINIDYKKENLLKICDIVYNKLDKDHSDLSGAKQAKIISIKKLGIQTVYNLETVEDHTYLANNIITHNTLTDAILGSAFMPAPIKWLNVAGAKTTSNFNNLSWQNMEKADSFMGNAFGNLSERFGDARVEAGKTYGRFSKSAYREAQNNIDFANRAWNLIMLMANLNEIQNIRALDMSSINNQRYAQMIQGGWNPIARGKQGMKIFNNATNHNIGMRLLSAAALIDNKAMILSAQGGTTLTINKHLPEVIITPTDDASWLFSDGRFKHNSRKPLGDKYTRKIVSNYLSKFDNENAKDYNARISRLSDVLDIRGVQFVENKIKSGKLKGRAHYIDSSGTAYVNNMDDIFAEVAHPWQDAKGNNYIIEEIHEGKYDSDSDPRGGTRYAYPDTAEGETHSFFEPTLLEWIKTGKIGKSSPLLNKKLSKQKIHPKNRVEVADSAASWNRQAIEKRILANPNQLPLWERIKYSFVNYPLLNKSK